MPFKWRWIGIFRGGEIRLTFPSCPCLFHIKVKNFEYRNKAWNRKFMSTTSKAARRSKEVIVVRHGETDWNRQLKVQGSTDIPLNDKGLLQAKATAQALLENYFPPPNSTTNIRIISSPLVRAFENCWEKAFGRTPLSMLSIWATFKALPFNHTPCGC